LGVAKKGMNEKLTRLWETKNKDDEWWSSFVSSPLAIAINYFVVDIKWLTPNLITLFSFIVAIISAVFIIFGGTVSFVIAAILIQFSYVLDCMDGQMARYRKTSSSSGSFFDKLTDQIQVTLWFGSVGYAAYVQSQSILPVFLAFTGVAFYNLRGYVKYIRIYLEVSSDNQYLDKISKVDGKNEPSAETGFSVLASVRWFIGEQRKILAFNEGVFIFMLSFSLVFNVLTPMLWLFAITQLFYGLVRGWQGGLQISRNQQNSIKK